MLVRDRTALENVELALTISGVGRRERCERALEALRLVGVEGCASKKPADLSSTQQRLVAIARALAKEPDILLADEPTCGIDKSSAKTVMDALERAAENRLVVMATSDEGLARAVSYTLKVEKWSATRPQVQAHLPSRLPKKIIPPSKTWKNPTMSRS